MTRLFGVTRSNFDKLCGHTDIRELSLPTTNMVRTGLNSTSPSERYSTPVVKVMVTGVEVSLGYPVQGLNDTWSTGERSNPRTREALGVTDDRDKSR